VGDYLIQRRRGGRVGILPVRGAAAHRAYRGSKYGRQAGRPPADKRRRLYAYNGVLRLPFFKRACVRADYLLHFNAYGNNWQHQDNYQNPNKHDSHGTGGRALSGNNDLFTGKRENKGGSAGAGAGRSSAGRLRIGLRGRVL
jgi:hypothetical protein